MIQRLLLFFNFPVKIQKCSGNKQDILIFVFLRESETFVFECFCFASCVYFYFGRTVRKREREDRWKRVRDQFLTPRGHKKLFSLLLYFCLLSKASKIENR